MEPMKSVGSHGSCSLQFMTKACKVANDMWSKVGRLKRSQMPRLTGGGATFGAGAGPGAMACIAGRLLCDTYVSSRELLREVSYTLTALSKSQLGRDRKELVPSEILGMYQASTTLLELIESGETDAWLALGLMFHLSVLPLTRQLTNISGNLWSRTLQGARAQRVEYLLLHEFHIRKFIVPDKISQREKENQANKRKNAIRPDEGMEGEEDEPFEAAPSDATGKQRKRGPAYLGGLVLEPKKGLYDRFVLLLDFNSLYPSIIQEYNVCFTTVDRPNDGSIPTLPSSETPGVLPQVLKGLVERRKQVKGWLKRTSDILKYQQLDIQQQALKLTANSMYGCLGFTNSRFYAKPIAELITSQVLKLSYDVVSD
jgi:DNA polymerase alpha subunit A